MRRKKRTFYGKLVRDRIPEVIRKNGGRPRTTCVLEDEAFKHALYEKLREEASELADAKGRIEVLEELADIHEVLRSIMQLHDISEREIFERQFEKMREKGRFDRRIFLEWVDEKEGK